MVNNESSGPTMGEANSNSNGQTEQPVVCVFCASLPGSNPKHLESARQLGKAIGEAGYKLVYGGGTMGIMGEVAKSVVKATRPENVEGIIPRALVATEKDPSTMNEPSASSEGTPDSDTKQAERTISRADLKRMDSADVIPQSEYGRTTIVTDMHTRKGLMAQRVQSGAAGSGFVALAGGYGTLEEVMEMVTWNQLGIHKLPIVLCNVDGYWDGLLQWVRNSIDEGFVRKGNADIIVEVKDPKDVIDALKNYKVAEGRFRLNWEKR